MGNIPPTPMVNLFSQAVFHENPAPPLLSLLSPVPPLFLKHPHSSDVTTFSSKMICLFVRRAEVSIKRTPIRGHLIFLKPSVCSSVDNNSPSTWFFPFHHFGFVVDFLLSCPPVVIQCLPGFSKRRLWTPLRPFNFFRVLSRLFCFHFTFFLFSIPPF